MEWSINGKRDVEWRMKKEEKKEKKMLDSPYNKRREQIVCQLIHVCSQVQVRLLWELSSCHEPMPCIDRIRHILPCALVSMNHLKIQTNAQ